MTLKREEILVWCDLEMTGLDVDTHSILEAAVIITDANLDIVAESEDIIIHQSEENLERMNPKVRAMHNASGLIERVVASDIDINAAQEYLLNFVRSFGASGISPLCGNSIYQDRIFLKKYMPQFNSFLHYRNIDVSSIKELVSRWYPQDPHAFFQKQKAHRAVEDIKESIAELRHYRQYFFI